MVSKMLIAVKSCQRDMERGDHQVIRGTWGKDARAAGIDVKFFVGQRLQNDRTGIRYEPDEILLSVKDDYANLPFKTREMCARMSGKKINGLFLCDTDTFIDVKSLIRSGVENYDYAGYFRESTEGTFPYDAIDRDGNREHHDSIYNWASGGLGYFLSAFAANAVADAYPSSWAEDLWVGQVIGPQHADGKMTIFNTRDNPVSTHYPSAKFGHNYDREGHRWMQEMYDHK